ncbi:MAG TPA: toprim domain-containing protein [Candidatus Paceibacterota bacterium]|nr:toprim domain-containing protein [Candidatus Paceibacterota bacterium]
MNPIERLTDLFEKFPGIGPRQARRFVQFLLAEQAGFRSDLSDSITHLGRETGQCRKCFRWFAKSQETNGYCNICGSGKRDSAILFVVEKDADIDNVEQSGFHGLYFVLGGTIPLASEEPERHVRLRELLKRIETDAAHLHLNELILGLSATTEGDHTRLIIQEKLRPIAEGLNFKISSLGRGLSTGSELEYADPDTIASALSSRQ